MEVIALAFGRIMVPPVNEAVMDLESFPIADKLLGKLRLRLNLSSRVVAPE